MKIIEKANITAVFDNMLTKDLPVFTIQLTYKQDHSFQNVGGFTDEAAISFGESLIKLVNIKDKSELKGQMVSACTEFSQPIAIGNESETQWIDLRDIDKIINGSLIKGNIIQYLEEKSKKIDHDFER